MLRPAIMLGDSPPIGLEYSSGRVFPVGARHAVPGEHPWRCLAIRRKITVRDNMLVAYRSQCRTGRSMLRPHKINPALAR